MRFAAHKYCGHGGEIQRTGKAVRNLYFGTFVKLFLPDPGDFANWEQDAGGISEPIRQGLTEIISTNLKSGSALPMVLKVGENVDAHHYLHVKTFAHSGHIYIGLHMLCPNPEL